LQLFTRLLEIFTENFTIKKSDCSSFFIDCWQCAMRCQPRHTIIYPLIFSMSHSKIYWTHHEEKLHKSNFSIFRTRRDSTKNHKL
jgi:hypothetical protein